MSLSRFLGGNLCVALWWLTSWLLVCFNSLAAPIPVIDAYKRPPNIIIFNVLPVIERTIVRCMKIAHSTGSWGLNATPKTFRSLRNGLGESMRQPCDVFNWLINRDSRLAKEIKENDKTLKQQVIPNEANQTEVRAGSGSGNLFWIEVCAIFSSIIALHIYGYKSHQPKLNVLTLSGGHGSRNRAVPPKLHGGIIYPSIFFW